MIEFYTLGNGWYTLDWDHSSKVAQYVFSPPQRRACSLKQEYANILETVNNPAVLMSGGIDSETVAEACLDFNIPFTPVIMKLEINGCTLNSFDIEHAEKWLSGYKIKPVYYILDLVKFYEQEHHLDYAAMYHCASPQLATHLWLIDQLDQTPVLAGDFLQLNGNAFSPNVFKYNCYDFYLHKNKRPGVARLLGHTAEIAEASIILQTKSSSFTSTYGRKCSLYQQGGFRATPKPNKFTGFELVLEYYQKKYNGEHLYQVFNERFRLPMEEIAQLPQTKDVHVWVDPYYVKLIQQLKIDNNKNI